jgi:hypothetical protein
MAFAYRIRRKAKRDIEELTARDKIFSKAATHVALEVLGCSVDVEAGTPRSARHIGFKAVQDGGISYAATVSIIALGISAAYIQHKKKSEIWVAMLMGYLIRLIADEFGLNREELWDLRSTMTRESTNAIFLFEKASQQAFRLYHEVSQDDALKRIVLAVAKRDETNML